VAVCAARRRRRPYEMRPVRTTPAHQTDNFAELVCSNSLKSESENTAPWLLKEEMRRAGSLLLEMARETAVPAGHALAVDRAEFFAQSDRGDFARRSDYSPARRVQGSRRRGTGYYDHCYGSAHFRCAVAGNCAVEFGAFIFSPLFGFISC